MEHKLILEDANYMKQFIKQLHMVLPCSLDTLISTAHTISPEIAQYCAKNASKFKELKEGDKGRLGKKVEFYVFGRLPNSDSAPDSSFGDIKTTHIKKCRDGYNAKDRLTITNCGNTDKYETLQHIADTSMKSNKLYPKLRDGIIIAFLGDEIKYIFRYDLEELDAEEGNIILGDYEQIQERVRTKTVSQKGQKYLHIHPHGSKQSKTRALGFTGKFVTTLIARYHNLTLREVGKSLVF
jgi:hypothetical protein